MKPVSAKTNRPLPIGAVLDVVDNSGARKLKIIGVRKYGGVKKRLAAAGVADVIVGTVKVGKPGMRKQVVLATIIRQRKEYRRPSGIRVKFEDNAAIILTDVAGTPKGSRIKGAIAKEVVERFPAVGKLSSVIV
ncbi:MAG: 50S ribosomal protein L14 [Nanoarchaeota archaeon]|nr:50S ribosomal protein L14 [Nanoarchaeota archaeon]